MRFEEWNLDPRLLDAIAKRGYVEATDVQARTLEVSLRNRDAAVQSQTGTGKTAAFLITVFDRLLKDPSRASGRTLIIVPTRELAAQIAGEARLLNKMLGFSIGCFYGGVATEPQLAQLRKGVDIVIGTPGRLLDLTERGALRLQDIRILVIDEADRLFGPTSTGSSGGSPRRASGKACCSARPSTASPEKSPTGTWIGRCSST
jgi:ATP-dependent RNA helicase RhlB